MIRLVQWAMERAYKAEQNAFVTIAEWLSPTRQCLRCAYALTYAFSKVLRFKDHANISWALSAWIDLVKALIYRK